MLITTINAIRPECLALALAQGVTAAKSFWLASVKAYALQRQPRENLPAYADPACIAGAFLFRVTLKGSEKLPGKVFVLDESRLALGLAKLASANPEGFARIAAGLCRVPDALALLQFSLFGAERF